MSTSQLFHAQGIRDFRHVKEEYHGGVIYKTIRKAPGKVRCPRCLSPQVKARNWGSRKILGLPIGAMRVILVVLLFRLRCAKCGADLRESMPFADPKARFTHHVARYVLGLRRHMTIDAIAKHLGLKWQTVKGIEKKYLKRKYANIPLHEVRMLGIDEIYVAHRTYMTVVLNLKTGEVLFVGKGRNGETLQPFLQKLKRSGAAIRAVAMDMSKAYTAWVKNHFPKARIVYDKFHVVKKMNEAVDEVRRECQSHLESKEDRRLLKGKRWLLLRGKENVEPDRQAELDELLQWNQPLSLAYQLKEKLRLLWDEPTADKGGEFLDEWCSQATASGVNGLVKMAKTLTTHRAGILSYFDCGRVTSARVEGFNNKIRWLIRQAYGYRDWEYFCLKVHHLPDCTMQVVL